ncbi:MAG TPA: ribonuclease HII [Bacteroidetes bacterium]|nr:ribonuclease HII [Bacteroidota bacterium]
MFTIESTLLAEGYQRIMGLDEVGRGCLAGPVVAAGVILDPANIPDGINDSKLLTHKQRFSLAHQIKATAIHWSIMHCEVPEILELNILWASLKAMQKCEMEEGANPDYLLVDGNRYIPTLTPVTCLVKGDSRSASIAAASILAKVYRDEYMAKLHAAYPEFNWLSNVGYPTKLHYQALAEFGYTRHHRTGFRLNTDKMYQEK